MQHAELGSVVRDMSWTQHYVHFEHQVPVLTGPVTREAKLINPIRPGLFGRSPSPKGGRGEGSSEARMPKFKFNIN